MTDRTFIAVPEPVLRALLDVATSSMDHASGFLDDDETEALRTVATLLGIDPISVTPDNHLCNYTGRHSWSRTVNGAFGGPDGEYWCRHCRTTTKTPALTDRILVYQGRHDQIAPRIPIIRACGWCGAVGHHGPTCAITPATPGLPLADATTDSES